MNQIRHHSISFIIFFSFLLPLPTYAQGDSPQCADSIRTLSELNVVALKQSNALRDDAVAATVIGMGELENNNVDAIKGISDMVPNFFMPDYGSRITSSIYVRGIGARMDQPSVGLAVDNLPVLNKNAYDFDIADIASVEMLRGPQSTMYGRNTIAGLINITTLSPLRFQGWRIMAQAASANDYKLSAGWYHKFNSRLASSVSLSGRFLGGFFKNAYNNSRVGQEAGGALRWKMIWNPTESLRFRNAFSTTFDSQSGYAYRLVSAPDVNYNDTCFYHRLCINDALTLGYSHAAFGLTSVTSLQYLDDNMTLDQDFLPLPYFTLTQRQKEIAVTEDILLKGIKREGLYEWKVGVFGFYKDLHMRAPVTFLDTGISSLIESHRNDANPTYPIAWDTREFDLRSQFRIPTYGVALYHESTLALGRWKLALGLRLDWEGSELHYRSSCDTGYEVYHRQDDGALHPYRHVDIVIDDRDHLRRSYFSWLPKFTALYSLPMEGENNLYINLSRGFKSGGFNTQMFSDVLQQRLMGVMGIGSKYDVDDVVGYRPEYSWNYEIGGHFTLFGSRLEMDLTAFYIDCHDQQLTMFPDGTTTGRVMTNAGRTRSTGAELTVTARPFERFTLRGSYGFTDARFVKFFNGIEDFSGKYLPYVPRNTIFAECAYEIPIRTAWLTAIEVEADVRLAGPIYWNESNSVSQNIYALPGASVTLRGKKWSLQVWGKNLSNTHYDTFYFMSMGNEFLQQGRPLQVGATLRLTL